MRWTHPLKATARAVQTDNLCRRKTSLSAPRNVPIGTASMIVVVLTLAALCLLVTVDETPVPVRVDRKRRDE